MTDAKRRSGASVVMPFGPRRPTIGEALKAIEDALRMDDARTVALRRAVEAANRAVTDFERSNAEYRALKRAASRARARAEKHRAKRAETARQLRIVARLQGVDPVLIGRIEDLAFGRERSVRRVPCSA